MHTVLLSKILHKKRINNRGVSSIIGAIFMILIVGSLASAYFFYTLNENALYNNAIRARNDFELARMSESVQISETVYRINSAGSVSISAKIFVIGGYSVNFTTLWLSVNEDVTVSNYTSLNIAVSGGGLYQLDATVQVSGTIPSGTYHFAAWLISSRGNTFALESLRTNSIVAAQTTQGIGSLAMDFQNFTYYQVKLVGTTYHVDLGTGTSAYTIVKSTAPLAICVNFTNFDTKNRDILLNQNSELFSIFPSTGGNYKAVTWYIIKVNAETGEILPFTSQTLAYSVSTLVFFAAMVPGSTTSFVASNDMFTGVCPVNLALTGTIGASPFGQNIPFVSILVT